MTGYDIIGEDESFVSLQAKLHDYREGRDTRRADLVPDNPEDQLHQLFEMTKGIAGPVARWSPSATTQKCDIVSPMRSAMCPTKTDCKQYFSHLRGVLEKYPYVVAEEISSLRAWGEETKSKFEACDSENKELKRRLQALEKAMEQQVTVKKQLQVANNKSTIVLEKQQRNLAQTQIKNRDLELQIGKNLASTIVKRPGTSKPTTAPATAGLTATGAPTTIAQRPHPLNSAAHRTPSNSLTRTTTTQNNNKESTTPLKQTLTRQPIARHGTVDRRTDPITMTRAPLRDQTAFTRADPGQTFQARQDNSMLDEVYMNFSQTMKNAELFPPVLTVQNLKDRSGIPNNDTQQDSNNTSTNQSNEATPTRRLHTANSSDCEDHVHIVDIPRLCPSTATGVRELANQVRKQVNTNGAAAAGVTITRLKEKCSKLEIDLTASQKKGFSLERKLQVREREVVDLKNENIRLLTANSVLNQNLMTANTRLQQLSKHI